MKNCRGCDKEIVIEVIQNGNGSKIGSVTLHDSISFDELGLIQRFALDSAKTMDVSMKWVKFPCEEFPVYKVCIIKTFIS